jgi:hypothetical protein
LKGERKVKDSEFRANNELQRAASRPHKPIPCFREPLVTPQFVVALVIIAVVVIVVWGVLA